MKFNFLSDIENMSDQRGKNITKFIYFLYSVVFLLCKSLLLLTFLYNDDFLLFIVIIAANGHKQNPANWSSCMSTSYQTI